MDKQQNAEAEQEASPTKGSKLLPVILLVVGLLAGGVSGALVAGPLMSKGAAASGKPAAKPAAHAEEGGEHAEEEGEEHAADEGHEEEAEEEHAEESSGGDHGGAASAEYVVEDLVLNPAASEGTRFLLTSIAFQLKSPELAETMKAKDAQIRDAIMGVLTTKTVEELMSPDSARTALKDELKKSVGKVLPRGSVRRVYLPKFVVQ